MAEISAFSAFRPPWRPRIITEADYVWCLALAVTHYTRCVRLADFTWFSRKSKRTGRFWPQNFDDSWNYKFWRENRSCVSAYDQGRPFQATKHIECSVFGPNQAILVGTLSSFLFKEICEAAAVTHCKIWPPKKIEVHLEIKNPKYFRSNSGLARATRRTRACRTSRRLATTLTHISVAFQALLWPGRGESRNGLQILVDFST